MKMRQRRRLAARRDSTAAFLRGLERCADSSALSAAMFANLEAAYMRTIRAVTDAILGNVRDMEKELAK